MGSLILSTEDQSSEIEFNQKDDDQELGISIEDEMFYINESHAVEIIRHLREQFKI